MSYYIEQDEQHEEYLGVAAAVVEKHVELVWPTSAEPEEYFSSLRGLAERTFGTPELKLTGRRATGFFKLFRRGNVTCTDLACLDQTFRYTAVELATEAILQMYDAVFPDVARHAQEAREQWLKLGRLKKEQILQCAVQAKPISDSAHDPGGALTALVEEHKDELRSGGSSRARYS